MLQRLSKRLLKGLRLLKRLVRLRILSWEKTQGAYNKELAEPISDGCKGSLKEFLQNLAGIDVSIPTAVTLVDNCTEAVAAADVTKVIVFPGDDADQRFDDANHEYNDAVADATLAAVKASKPVLFLGGCGHNLNCTGRPEANNKPVLDATSKASATNSQVAEQVKRFLKVVLDVTTISGHYEDGGNWREKAVPALNAFFSDSWATFDYESL